MKFDDEFKKAIANLPPKEKDKLILRLLKKDYILANRLYFELVSTDNVEDRRLEKEAIIRNYIEKFSKKFSSPQSLLSDLRTLSAEITEHVKITKDKYGEASLNLLMLNESLGINNEYLNKCSPNNSHKYNVYVIARAYKILTLIIKLHEDFHIEFENGLEELSDNIANNHYLMKTAIYSGFDVNWLRNFDIPDNINERLKEARDLGLLR